MRRHPPRGRGSSGRCWWSGWPSTAPPSWRTGGWGCLPLSLGQAARPRCSKDIERSKSAGSSEKENKKLQLFWTNLKRGGGYSWLAAAQHWRPQGVALSWLLADVKGFSGLQTFLYVHLGRWLPWNDAWKKWIRAQLLRQNVGNWSLFQSVYSLCGEQRS